MLLFERYLYQEQQANNQTNKQKLNVSTGWVSESWLPGWKISPRNTLTWLYISLFTKLHRAQVIKMKEAGDLLTASTCSRMLTLADLSKRKIKRLCTG